MLLTFRKKISDDVSIDSQSSEYSFKVPASDIKNRKKTNIETESVIKESSQAITAICSTLLSNTSKKVTSKEDTEEDKSITVILSQELKRVPVQQRTRCLIKLLEVFESFRDE